MPLTERAGTSLPRGLFAHLGTLRRDASSRPNKPNASQSKRPPPPPPFPLLLLPPLLLLLLGGGGGGGGAALIVVLAVAALFPATGSVPVKVAVAVTFTVPAVVVVTRILAPPET